MIFAGVDSWYLSIGFPVKCIIYNLYPFVKQKSLKLTP
nr:MAG TPA: hypothetical protein [Caudoviricetes sp.]